MKVIELLGIAALSLAVFSCNTTGEKPTNKPTDEPTAELEVVTEYGPDSSYKIEYQVNKANNQKNGWYKEYGEDGTLMVERSYVDNKAEGVEKSYYPSGNVESELGQKDGQYHGAFKYFYEDGTVKQEGEFQNDKMEGLIKTYYSNGTLKEEVTLVNNFTQGPFKEYNQDGSLKTEGAYTSKGDQEGLETGELRKYDETGELIEKMMCKDGQCCTTWTKEKGEVPPSSKLCDAIINGQ